MAIFVEIKEVVVHTVCAVPIVMYEGTFHVPRVYGTVDVGTKKKKEKRRKVRAEKVRAKIISTHVSIGSV